MTYQTWNAQMAALSNKLNLEDLCKVLRIESFEDEDPGCDAYHYYYQSALESGATEEAAESAGIAGESKEQDARYRRFCSAVEATAERFFALHKLDITKLKDGRYSITPMESWEDSAGAIKNTINGVGMFYFRSTKEFMTSGPYTARQAVLSHLHHIPSWSDVYGEARPRAVFSRMIQN